MKNLLEAFVLSVKKPPPNKLCQLPAVIQSASLQPTFDPTKLKPVSLSLSHSLLHTENCILMHEPSTLSDGAEGHGGVGGGRGRVSLPPLSESFGFEVLGEG